MGGWIGRHLHATADARAAPIRAISIGTALDPAIADSTEFRIRSREPELWAAALPLLHEGIGDSYEEQSERGRVNGGQVFADWPGLHAAALDDGDLRITLDYRAVLAEILGAGFGNPAIAEVFPGFETTPRLGLLRF